MTNYNGDKLYRNTGFGLAVLGILMFAALPGRVFLGLGPVPGGGFALDYSLSFAGCAFLAWGLLLRKIADDAPMVSKLAVSNTIGFSLCAVVRVISLGSTGEAGPSFGLELPETAIIAIWIGEIALFSTLSFLFWRKAV